MIEKRIQTNGIEIFLKESEKTGETVLLLHCSSWNSEQWGKCIPELAKNYHVLAPDMRGHGRSDCPAEGYRLKDFAKDLHGMLEVLHIEKVHLVGSSMGAEIALRFASDYPDKVLSLTLEGAFQNFYGPNGEMELPSNEMEADYIMRLEKIKARPIETYTSEDAMLSHYKHMFAEEPQTAWNESWEAIHRNRFRSDANGDLSVVFKPHLLAQYCEDFYLMDFAELYNNVTCPVQFLPDTREASDAGVLKSIEQFRHLIKNSHTIVSKIEGAEHASTPLIKPQAYVSAVQSFLVKVRN